MTTYDQKTGKWTFSVAYSGVTKVTVDGEFEMADAKAAAKMAVETNLAPTIENEELTVGNWPLSPEVIALETEIEGVIIL